MKKQFLLFSSLCLLLASCETRTDTRTSRERGSQNVTPGGEASRTDMNRPDATRTDTTTRTVRDRNAQEA